MNRFFLLPGVLVFLLCATALAQSANQQPQEAAVRAMVESYVAAFNAGDVKALAADWRDDGVMIDLHGNHIVGRAAIEKSFADFFAKHRDQHLAARIVSIQTPKEGQTIVELSTQLHTSASAEPSQVQSILHLVRTDGHLLIASARDAVFVPPSADHLKELQWLVGGWACPASEPGRVSVEGTYSWTANKSFLIHMFTARRGDLAVHGTEVIGWDPQRKAIRSWIFGSHGGFSEGLWKRDAKRWVIDSKGVLPDGSDVSATNILTPVDTDTISFQSQDRKRGGKAEPDVGPVTLRRQKPASSEPRAPLGGLPEGHGSGTP